MSGTLFEIEEQARKLSADDRARLAELLLESLQDTLTADIATAWRREIKERVAAYDRGDVDAFAAEDVFAEARGKSE